ncbi:MAG: biopolymer transporter ExbD [Chlamydiae bacterium CG10_big_fil_rev_8_21_14_0_10_35_9]|nr:MAG: biopolymer transporter ExbD [Chlamydiae bacterium CG10_big_fil_rev_8_21_14_0_10_35_9]
MKLRKKSYFDDLPHDENFINLTPLIDVVFVVLISFIIIAPLVQIEKINLAEAGESAVNKKIEGIKIYVKPDDSIEVDQKKINLDELLKIMTNYKKQDPSSIPFIFHDEKASFGKYQQIKNLLEKIGFDEMDIVLSSHGN